MSTGYRSIPLHVSLAIILLSSASTAFHQPFGGARIPTPTIVRSINTIQHTSTSSIDTRTSAYSHHHKNAKSVTTSTMVLHATPFSIGGIGSIATTVFKSSAVQKVLELAVITGIGASLKSKLDVKGTTALLLNALVPSIIVSSLSSLSVSAEMGYVLLAGVLLAVAQQIGSELASRFVINKNAGGDSHILQRTAALQLGTMAPGLSVLCFTREFVGNSFAGLSTLADVPSKLYSLVLMPYNLRFRGIIPDDLCATDPEMVDTEACEEKNIFQQIVSALKDPFNLSITSGLALAALGRPVSTLGFLGNAIGSIAASQTAVLFLLIGLKLKWNGERPKLCLRLLLARHGFMSLFVSAFFATCMRGGSDAAKLATVLSSHAASSIIAYGQMNKVVVNEGVGGYDPDLAFDIVALSYQVTMGLNTVACLAGASYVNNLPFVGLGLLAGSAVLGKIGKDA